MTIHKVIKHNVIKFFLQVCLILISVEVFADYGESCPNALLPVGVDDYLKSDTAYGHIISNIDMRKVTDGCDPNDPKFKFCIKQISNNNGNIVVKCQDFALEVGESKTLMELAGNQDPQFGGNYLLKDVPLTVKILPGHLMCLTMATSRGDMPVACKPTISHPTPFKPLDQQCKNIGRTCYGGVTKSQSLFNFSGVAIDCVKETLDKVFFQHNSCAGKDDREFILLNPFSNFQESLKVCVRMALIAYVMLYAINLILEKEYATMEKIAPFFIKLLLVTYFGVGLGPVYFKDGKETQANGMLEYGLPLLTGFVSQFVKIVFDAAGSQGLCEFDRAKYKKGYDYYGIWDAVDCRIGYYLGLEILSQPEVVLKDIGRGRTFGDTSGTPITFKDTNNKAVKTLKNPGTFRFFPTMFGFFMSGHIIIVISGIAFCIIFISVILYFLTNYLVCLVTIYVMTYISPIFIPMALFARTKGYFDGWLKVCISCTLQPAVIGGFIALLVTMYDSAIYKNCKFVRHDYTYKDVNFSTFEMKLPSSEDEECKSSAGYKLLKYYSGYGWDEQSFLLFAIKQIPKDVASLLISLLYVLVFSVIFYYFSKSIGQFASDVTSGPNMDAVTASPTKIVDMVKKGIDYIKAGAEASAGKVPDKSTLDDVKKGGEEASNLGDSIGGGSDKDGDSMAGGK